LAISANGNEALRIDSSGRLGIGNNNPTYKLDITTAADGVAIRTTDGVVQTRIQNGTSGGLVAGHIGTATNHPLAFYTNSSGPRLVLDTAGKVSIGVGAAGNATLEVDSVAAGTVTSIFKGAGATTADLTQWQNSVGTVLASDDKNGSFRGFAQATTNQGIASGATADFNTGNVQIMSAPGGSTITLNNMQDGGAYTLIINDTTPRTYTFPACTAAYFAPTNGPTTGQTVYTLLKTTIASTTSCYITWITGF
jgi:hypothetical protein